MTTVALAAAVVLTGLLAGNELGTLALAHPALEDLPLPTRVAAERALTHRLDVQTPSRPTEVPRHGETFAVAGSYFTPFASFSTSLPSVAWSPRCSDTEANGALRRLRPGRAKGASMHLEPLISVPTASMRPLDIGSTPAGHRMNLQIEGDVAPGGRVDGHISGIDYLCVRPDGVIELNIRATLTSEMGEIVAVRGSGLAVLSAEGPAQGRIALTYQTASQDLAWLNRTLGVAVTQADMAEGTLQMSVHTVE